MVAGVLLDILSITITETITKRKQKKIDKSVGMIVYRELYWGAFSRTLPEEVDQKK